MSATARIFAGTWRGLARALDRVAQAALEIGVERRAGLQAHEQHDARVVAPFLRHDDAFGDLRERLDDAVDLGRADAHAAGVQHRIGAAVDDRRRRAASARRSRRDARRSGSARSRRRGTCGRPASFQKPIGIDGNGAVQTSSPFCSRTERPVGREDLDLHAEAAALQLAAMDGQQRIAEREARDQVGAARDRRELHVGLDAAIDVVEARRARAASPSTGSSAAPAARAARARLEAGLLERAQIFRARAEDR